MFEMHTYDFFWGRKKASSFGARTRSPLAMWKLMDTNDVHAMVAPFYIIDTRQLHARASNKFSILAVPPLWKYLKVTVLWVTRATISALSIVLVANLPEYWAPVIDWNSLDRGAKIQPKQMTSSSFFSPCIVIYGLGFSCSMHSNKRMGTYL